MNFVMVNSITYAMKGKKILEKNDIKAYIEKTPKHLQSSGCGYSIYIKEKFSDAKNILRAEEIEFREAPEGET